MAEENLTDISFIYNDYQRALTSNTAFAVFGTLVGIVGNFVIIVFYFLRWRVNEERYFIPILAFVDCMACISGGCLYVLSNLFWLHFPSDILCRLLYFIHVFISAVSGHIILAISVQRYLLICKPYGPHLTLFRKRTSLVLITIVSLVYSLPVLKISGTALTQETYQEKPVVYMECYFVTNNTPIHSFYTYLLLVITLANITAVIAVYSPFIRKYRSVISTKNIDSNSVNISTIDLFRQRLNTGSTQTDSFHESGQENNSALQGEADNLNQNRHFESREDTSRAVTNRKKRMVTRMSLMFSVIIVCYMLSYFPSLVILVLRYTLQDFRYLDFSEVQFFFWMFIGRFVFINHFINPFIYGYFDVELRNTLKCQIKRIYVRNK